MKTLKERFNNIKEEFFVARIHEAIVDNIILQWTKENRGRLFKNHNGNAFIGKIIYETFRNDKRIVKLSGTSRIKYGLGTGTSDLIGWEYIKHNSKTIDDWTNVEFVPVFCSIEVKTKRYKDLTKDQIDWLTNIEDIGGMAYIAMETDNGYELKKFKGEDYEQRKK